MLIHQTFIPRCFAISRHHKINAHNYVKTLSQHQSSTIRVLISSSERTLEQAIIELVTAEVVNDSLRFQSAAPTHDIEHWFFSSVAMFHSLSLVFFFSIIHLHFHLFSVCELRRCRPSMSRTLAFFRVSLFSGVLFFFFFVVYSCVLLATSLLVHGREINAFLINSLVTMATTHRFGMANE